MSKNIKRTAAGIAALSVLTSLPGLTAFAADAEPEFTSGQIPVLIHSMENQNAIDCRYYSDLPSIPYVKLSDYYTLWTEDSLEITDRGDGVFDIKVPYGTEGVIDTVKDTISTEDRSSFFAPSSMLNGENLLGKLFISFEEGEVSGEEEATVELDLDLTRYSIDLRADAGDIWAPLSTLCDLFYNTADNGTYFEDTLIFAQGLNMEFMPYVFAMTVDHTNVLLENYKDGRASDLTKFAYNELCLIFDLYYGCPGRLEYTDMLKEKGLDYTLSELNDSTRRIRELLLSDNYMDYCIGVDNLNCYLWDGGHTQITSLPVLANKEYNEQMKAALPSYGLTYEGAADVLGDQYSSQMSIKGAEAARKTLLESADFATELPGAVYCEKGDTAVYRFDLFMLDTDAWYAYYNADGEMPQDVLSCFYQCVLRADENPAIKNFVVDLGTNTGGLTLTAQYMMGVISDLKSSVLADNTYGITAKQIFKVDKNLDKAFDEKDEAFKTDLRFGIITSKESFSCGNWMPYLAQSNNILLMGEQSGGGACSVEYHILPDGIPFAISAGTSLVAEDGKSIDLGIKPDYENVKYLDDGTKDFSDTYNIETISKCFDEFYGKAEPVVTEPAVTEPAGTTSAATTSTTVSSTSATVTTVATSETTATQTTVSKPDPSKYFAPVSDMGKMAVKDYAVRTGKEAANSLTKQNADGTVTIDLVDLSGNVIDTYTINPETGTGTDKNGAAVNLPQTGNNSLGTVSALAAALVLLGAGSAAVVSVRRKKESSDEA